MIVVGAMSGVQQFDPNHAIILQNKDELLIPLVTEILPSAKDFRDATASLSPKQQDFCKAFRDMQLKSTMFGVVIIQLKPQLERLLGLCPGTLKKEIQLTQDLLRLFIEFQVPGDLLSFDGASDASKENRLEAVKGHVAALLSTRLQRNKKKFIFNAGQRAEYRMAECVGNGSVASNRSAGELQRQMLDAFTWLRQKAIESEGSDAGSLGDYRSIGALQTDEGPNGGVFTSSLTGKMRTDDTVAMYSPTIVPDSTMFPNELEKSDTGTLPATDIPAHVVHDLTMFPKELDKRMEQLDADNVLHSTKILAELNWCLQQQENILSTSKTSVLMESDIQSAKKSAFDLLDAISRSGSLPIASSEVRDGINFIAKVEKSAILLASTLHRVSPSTLIANPHYVERLRSTFPSLFDATIDSI